MCAECGQGWVIPGWLVLHRCECIVNSDWTLEFRCWVGNADCFIFNVFIASFWLNSSNWQTEPISEFLSILILQRRKLGSNKESNQKNNWHFKEKFSWRKSSKTIKDDGWRIRLMLIILIWIYWISNLWKVGVICIPMTSWFYLNFSCLFQSIQEQFIPGWRRRKVHSFSL